MNLRKDYKLENAVGKDDDRPEMLHPYFDRESGVAVATNGKIMAVVPVDASEDDTAGHIPIEAITAARKINWGDCPIKLNENARLEHLGKVQEWPRADKRYPNWKNAVPNKDRKEVRLTLDAALLLRLAKALGKDDRGSAVITLRIASDASGGIDARSVIVVEGLYEAYGLMMPS